MSDFFIWIWIFFTIFIGAEMINLLFKEKPMSKSDAGYASELHEAVRLFISQPLNNPLTRGQIMEIARIALPILEQQDHEKSIIAGQLEAVRDSLSLTPHQDAIISCAIDRLNVLTLRTLELSRSLIKQQDQPTNQNGEQ